MSGYKTGPFEALPVARQKKPIPAPGLARVEGSHIMRHNLNLNLGSQVDREKVVGLRNITLRERFARFLLGDKKKFTIVVPGDSVDQVTITQKSEDDLMALADAVMRHPSNQKREA